MCVEEGSEEKLNEKDTWRLNISVRIAQLPWLPFSFVCMWGERAGRRKVVYHETHRESSVLTETRKEM